MRRVRDVLGGAFDRGEVLRTARAQIVLRRWSEVVGESLAERSIPDRYDRGTVWVAVQGSAWANELRMIKDRILERLNDLAGESGLFLDVRFGERPPRDAIEEEAPKEQEPAPDRDEVRGLSIREIAERRLRSWDDEERA